MTNTSTPQEVVEWISEFVMEAIERLRIDKQMVIGIGVGTVGPLDRKKGIILNPKNFLSSGWNNVPIEEMLEKRLALPVIVDNGANMAALAEGFFGEGKDFNNIAYINCGAGIRTGAITLGSVVRAINDEEDAFGHMVVDFDGEICSCGNYGCVECYSSISAILKKFTSELKKGRSTIIEKTPEELDYEDICKAAARGDELAKETLVNAGTAFGIGLANYINLLNPQVVILSGPLIKHSELFFETCTGVAFKKNYLKYKNRIHFSRGGAFKENSIAVGAAASMIEELLSPEYDWENK